MTGAEVRWRRPGRAQLVRLVAEIGALALGVHLLLPQLSGLERTGEQLARATWWLPVVVVVLEAASLLAYGQLLTTTMGRSGPRPRWGLVQRTVVVGLSLGRTLPAGSAAAFAVTVQALGRSGVDRVAAATALATSSLLSSVVLAALLPIGVALALTTGEVGGAIVSAVAVAAAVLAVAAVTPLALRHPDRLAAVSGRLARTVARGPLRRRVDPEAVAAGVRHGVDGIRALLADRRTLASSTGWALANWLLDVGVVLVVAATIGRGTPLGAVLLAYLVAQLAAAVPITPGGVGVVESAMIGVLVAAGSPAAAATATVLGWRLVSHWLPIAVGLGLLPTVRGARPIRRDR